MANDPFDPQRTPAKPIYARTAWSHGYQHSATPAPKGDAAYTNIGSHEKVGPSPHKQAIADAGMKGERAPGGPRGPNAPIPAKKPKGR
jgi:hypothetical protein